MKTLLIILTVLFFVSCNNSSDGDPNDPGFVKAKVKTDTTKISSIIKK